MDSEAQGEIKGSLEEVGEGDQTVVVAATLDRLVNSRPTALHLQVPAIRLFSPLLRLPELNDSMTC